MKRIETIRRVFVCVFGGMAALSMTVAPARGQAFLGTFGSQGTGLGKFENMGQIAFAPDGTLYVPDSSNNRVTLFSPDGVVLNSFPVLSPYAASFSPQANELAVIKSGGLVIFNPDGTLLRESAFLDGATCAFRGADEVFVADFGGSTITRVSTADMSFALSPMAVPKPGGIAVFPDGRFAVTAEDDSEVYLFSAAQEFAAKFGSPGSGIGQLSSPTGIAVAANNRIFVCDAANDRVQIFSESGQPLAAFGSSGTGPGQFNYPYFVTVLPNGRVYVVDSLNYRAAIYLDLDSRVLPLVKPSKKRAVVRGGTARIRGTATVGFGTLLNDLAVRGGKRRVQKVKFSPTTLAWRANIRLKPGKKQAALRFQSSDKLRQRSKPARVRVTVR